MSVWRKQAAEGLNAGMVFRFSRTFTQEDVKAFGAITRDYNPIHYDRRFSSSKGFSGLVCHGLLVGSMIAEIGGQIGWLASGMEFQFLRPAYIGETITCELTISEIDDRHFARADAVFHNQEGVTVLSAKLTGRVPRETERKLLSIMIEEGDPTNKHPQARIES